MRNIFNLIETNLRSKVWEKPKLKYFNFHKLLFFIQVLDLRELTTFSTFLRSVFLFIFLINSITYLSAQKKINTPAKEQLYIIEMKNGNILKGSILGENKEEVRFKTQYMDTLNLLVTTIYGIRKMDGLYFVDLTVKKATNPASNVKKTRPPNAINELPYIYKKNMLTWNVFDLIFLNITAAYEWIPKGGYVGIKIPATIGMAKTGEGKSMPNNKQMSIGLDLNFYLAGQNEISWFMGSGIEFGNYKYKVINKTEGNIKVSEAKPLTITYTTLYILNMGIITRMSKKFSVIFKGGLGVRWDDNSGFYNYYNVPSKNRYGAGDLWIGMTYGF